MDNLEKLVEFDKYCKSCKYETASEHSDPCDECLTYPTNTNTNQPVLWEEKS